MIGISLARLFLVVLDKTFAGISCIEEKSMWLWILALVPLKSNGENWRTDFYNALKSSSALGSKYKDK